MGSHMFVEIMMIVSLCWKFLTKLTSIIQQFSASRLQVCSMKSVVSCQRQKYAMSSRLLDATLRKRYTEGWDGQTDTTHLFTLRSCRVYFEMTFTENTSELEEHD